MHHGDMNFNLMFMLYLVISLGFIVFFFFFQAEDGIRDIGVTGVQTCALPISRSGRGARMSVLSRRRISGTVSAMSWSVPAADPLFPRWRGWPTGKRGRASPG